MESDQIELTQEVAPNNFKEFKQILESTTDEELINYYNTICNESTTILDISQKYQIPTIKDGSLNNSPAYRTRRKKWRNEFINLIIETLEERYKKLKPPDRLFPEAPKLNENGLLITEVEDMKDKTNDLLNKVDNKPQDKLYYQNQISPNQLNRIHLKQLTEND